MRKNSIYVLLQGGLGNQLFQYAFAKSLLGKHYYEVKLDLSALQENVLRDETSFRQFSLGNVPFPVSQKHILSSETLRNMRIWNSLRNKPWQLFKLGYIKVFIAKIVQVSKKTTVIGEREWINGAPFSRFMYKNIVLDGFWQNFSYPLSVESSLRTEFRERVRCCDSATIFENRVRSEDALAVHIRRGDYASNSNATNFHGLLTAEYFNKAIFELTHKFEVETIYVFSDDVEWCKANLLHDSRLVFVSDAFGNICDLDELLIMSACSFFIISNSTFSWWAAWLSNVEGERIIAPAEWFADKTANLRFTRLVPDGWCRMPSKFHEGSQP